MGQTDISGLTTSFNVRIKLRVDRNFDEQAAMETAKPDTSGRRSPGCGKSELFAHLVSDKTADCSAAQAPRGATGSQYGSCKAPNARRHCDALASQRHALSGIQDEQQGYSRCAQHDFFKGLHHKINC